MIAKPIIVGMDPGATVGLAYLDARGGVLDVESGKGISPADVIWAIRQKGDPIIIATDKEPLPEAVRRVASAFDCRLYVPPQSLSQEEKNGLVRSSSVSNNHEADALAAALKAYGAFSAKLRQLERQEGPDFEQNVRSRLLGSRVERQPAVVVTEREVIVEKPVEKYEAKVEELRHAVQRLERSLENQQNIVRMQRKRIEELEAFQAGALAQSAVARAAGEKGRAEAALREFASAFRRGELKIASGETLTEDREFFEKCRREGRECTLAKILYNDGHTYYVEIEHHEPRQPVSLAGIVDEYRKKRK